jgi:hypothetical protein
MCLLTITFFVPNTMLFICTMTFYNPYPMHSSSPQYTDIIKFIHISLLTVHFLQSIFIRKLHVELFMI